MAKRTKRVDRDRYAIVCDSQGLGSSAGEERTVDGVRVKSFTRPIMRSGNYTHPVEKWKLDVTNARLDKWVAAFDRMQKMGVDVEVVVDHSFSAKDAFGYLTGMHREGDWLYGTHEMRGDEGIDLAERVQNISIWLDKDYVCAAGTGDGTHVGEAIIHSSLVQGPVVPGQQDAFLPAPSRESKAASRSPVFSMGVQTMEMNEWRELIGADDSLKENGLFDAAKAHIGLLATDKAEAEKQLTDALGTVKTLEQQIVDDGGAEVKIDPDVIDGLREGAEGRIEALVASAKITPDVAKELSAILIGTVDKPNVFALSRRVSKTPESMERRITKMCSKG